MGDGPSAADDTGAQEGEPVPLSLDAVLLLLADGRMRAILNYLHSPKLADAGVVEYDERSRRDRYWRNDRLERWLERIESEGA